MKIIHCVESYSPAVNGMQTVVSQLSERLVKLGHEVIVLTSKNNQRKQDFINGVRVIGFEINGNVVTGIIGETEKYIDFLLNTDFDVYVNFAAQQWSTDLALPILDEIKAKKVFVPTGFSGLYHSRFSSYFKEMETWIKSYDACVFLSDDYRDINFARLHGSKKNVLIPNGADEREFNIESSHEAIKDKLKIPENSFLILTVGSHTGLKGHDETIKIFKKAKLKNAALLIVGNSANFTLKYLITMFLKTALSLFYSKIKPDCTFSCCLKGKLYNYSFKRLVDKNKIITTKVDRTDTVALYKNADVFLFPSNIECSPIVLFECCAASLPFLVNDVGNSREIIEWTNGGELLPTKFDENNFSLAIIDGSVKKLKEFYHNAAKRQNLGKNGRNAFNGKFTWQKIASSYEALYTSLLKN